MKKPFMILGAFFLFLAGCGESETKSEGDSEPQMYIEDLDKEKAKEAIVEEALNMNFSGEAYQASDIVNIEVCEALHIDHKSDGFKGEFITFFKTSDGNHKEHFLINDQYEIEKIANYDRIPDRCVNID
ncbi:hypothetical protein [Oceanobacillus sojae]|uniref:hypothetical protein n=1 Tax=Oceanobacillus sojae TaxID=582851 RepID=UPI0021A3E40D|nr:hypothetical protein [Oceanobacillus sojae]MCT1901548.1 hypothetical protein [Oceanobacillus sojae]